MDYSSRRGLGGVKEKKTIKTCDQRPLHPLIVFFPLRSHRPPPPLSLSLSLCPNLSIHDVVMMRVLHPHRGAS